MSTRRLLLKVAYLKSLVAGSVLIWPNSNTNAQDLPPIRWIVPFPPGGGSDLATRIVAKRASELLSRLIVVENKPGAATMLAAAEVARLKPESPNNITLLTAGMSTLTLNPSLYSKITYQADKDFQHISTLVRLPMVLVVNPQLPAVTLSEVRAWLKDQGNRASYASLGAGTPHHVVTALWLEQSGLVTTHVPYKGTPQALQDVAGNSVSMMFGDVAAAVPLIKAGKLKAIAVPSLKRSAVLPEVPTFSEQGSVFEGAAWQGVVTSKGIDSATTERISSAISRALLDPSVISQLTHHGMEALGSKPDEFAKFANLERARWSRIIATNNISIE